VPRLVDHERRREELAAALWRLVLRDGIEAASVRRVAAEAGWSTGSLRHYFATQSELLSFAMDLVVQRVTVRVEALTADPDPRTMAARLLHEVLPLDAERHAEMQVWLAFTARSFVEPELRALRDHAHTGLRSLCVIAAELLGVPSSGRERVAELLHALIDGLALHAVIDPATTTPARQVELLAAELDALASCAARSPGSASENGGH
jgi:AcrR family transcriptional regulator